MSKEQSYLICAVFFAVAVLASCVAAPDVRPEPEGESAAPAPEPFPMKPFHKEMMEEMRQSYERADEILFGIYAGSHEDERLGRIHYFDNYSTFDKSALSWGPVMKVIVQVQAQEINPEIIEREEFLHLSDLDRVGICWDLYERIRYVYLVEGEKMLIFLQTGFDEVNTRSYRNLIDAYPSTQICLAKDVFDLMIRDIRSEKAGRKR
jgi:hypothetical protein